MSTRSPISGLGGQQAFGRANFRLTVITIFAVHSAVLAGLLLQGCKRSSSGPPVAGIGADTNLVKTPTYELGTVPQPSTQAGQTGAVDTAGSTLPAVTQQIPQIQQPVTEVQTTQQATQLAPIEYVVKPGDVPFTIAKEHGVSLSAFMEANPGLDPRRLKVGQVVIIPPPDQGQKAAKAKEPSVPGEGGQIHVVQRGETLTKIARQYGVTVADLRTANDLKSDRILVGQKLKIPAPRTGQTTPTANPPSGGGLVLPPGGANG